jgi:hypothetical protein
MADALNQIIADVEAKAKKSLVVLVDGLDRMDNPDLIRLIFADQRQFLDSPTLCDRLLYSSVVLNYINEGDWYDVHAILWDVERGTTE